MDQQEALRTQRNRAEAAEAEVERLRGRVAELEDALEEATNKIREQARAALSAQPDPVREVEPEDSEEIRRLNHQIEALKTALFDIPECDWRAAWWELWLKGSDRNNDEAMALILKAAPRIEEVKLKSEAERAVVEAAMRDYRHMLLDGHLEEMCRNYAKIQKGQP